MPSWVKNTSVYLEFQLIELFLLQEFLYTHESLIGYQIKFPNILLKNSFNFTGWTLNI